MNTLLVTLRLVDPVLLSGVGNGEENSSRTLPYIPGSAIRGALVGRFKPETSDLPIDTQAARLFFSEKVIYLNAYPVANNLNTRSLPLPASWHIHKGEKLDGAEIADFALKTDLDKEEPLKRVFCYPDSDGAKSIVLNPKEELAIHISSQERGIVTSENSTVFQYQALARGQLFVSAIVAEEPQDLVRVKELLDKDRLLVLGRSRSAGYGRVRIENIQQETNWLETDEGYPEQVITITLLSDTILRNQFGQPTFDLDEYLSNRLEKKINNKKAFIQQTVVGGFNRKWGLPLPQMQALGMGSVFVYGADKLSPEELAPLIASGIGEHRVDGYGRLAVNWPGKAVLKVYEYQASSATLSISLSSASQDLAQTMAGRLLQQQLKNLLLAHAQKYDITGVISNHTLSRLRNLLRQIINQEKYEFPPVQEFLNSLRPTARSQFERVRVVHHGEKSGSRLWTWIHERLADNDGVIQISFNESEIPEVAGQKVSLSTADRREYTLRLIEAVLDVKMKQNRNGGQK